MSCPTAPTAALGCVPQGRGVWGQERWGPNLQGVTEGCLHLRHRQGLSLQQRDWGSALDLKGLTGRGAPCDPQLHVGRAGRSTGCWQTPGVAPEEETHPLWPNLLPIGCRQTVSHLSQCRANKWCQRLHKLL